MGKENSNCDNCECEIEKISLLCDGNCKMCNANLCGCCYIIDKYCKKCLPKYQKELLEFIIKIYDIDENKVEKEFEEENFYF